MVIEAGRDLDFDVEEAYEQWQESDCQAFW